MRQCVLPLSFFLSLSSVCRSVCLSSSSFSSSSSYIFFSSSSSSSYFSFSSIFFFVHSLDYGYFTCHYVVVDSVRWFCFCCFLFFVVLSDFMGMMYKVYAHNEHTISVSVLKILQVGNTDSYWRDCM